MHVVYLTWQVTVWLGLEGMHQSLVVRMDVELWK